MAVEPAKNRRTSDLGVADGGEDVFVGGAEEAEGFGLVVGDTAFAVDDDDAPGGAAGQPTFHPVKRRDFAVGIGKQPERQLVLLGKALVRFDRIGRDADDLGTGRLILRPMVADRAKLRRANGRVIAGIEQQDDHPPAMLAQRPVIAIAVT